MVERCPMMGMRAIDPGNFAAGRDRLLAALLVVALLLCHGALDVLHGAPQQPAEHAGGHHSHAAYASAPMDHGTYHDGDSPAYADCAAALFVVLLGAALVLLSGSGLMRRLDALYRAPGCVPPPFALPPPRGPTLPLLQVFRL